MDKWADSEVKALLSLYARKEIYCNFDTSKCCYFKNKKKRNTRKLYEMFFSIYLRGFFFFSYHVRKDHYKIICVTLNIF